MKLSKLIIAIVVVWSFALGYYLRHQGDLSKPYESNTENKLSAATCEEQGGHVVFGIGPAPECETNEISLGRIQETGAIEWALCCK